jgi:hypothetical protein
MSLKSQLQKTQAEKASRLEDSLLAPALYEHYQKVSVMLSKSGVIPNAYKGKPEDIFVAMAMGYQLGFPVEQSLQDIAVINGRPCLWGDGLLSLALNHAECESIDEIPIIDAKGNLVGYQCTVVRRGHKPHTKQFTLQDASVAGLLSRGTVWKAYPERMLQMRARSFAIRDKFADALRGLRVAEIEDEDSRIIDVESTVTVHGQTQVEKLKSILEGQVSDNDNNSDIDDNNSTTTLITKAEVQRKHGSIGAIRADRNTFRTATSEQITRIHELFIEKDFSKDRMYKAMDYYKIDAIEELTDVEAQAFITQLEKV